MRNLWGNGLFDSRLRAHFLLAVACLVVLVAAWGVGESDGALDRVSLVSAYLFLALISVVLLIGPLRAVQTGRTLGNHMVRRDVAIWAAFTGLVHLVAGVAQSMTPQYLEVFVTHAAVPPSAAMREAYFFWSAIVGFVVGILLVILLLLSNNWSLTLIGQRWWKRLHRLSYIVFALTFVHGLGFQILESRSWIGYVLVVTIMLVVCIAQVRGIRAVLGRK